LAAGEALAEKRAADAAEKDVEKLARGFAQALAAARDAVAAAVPNHDAWKRTHDVLVELRDDIDSDAHKTAIGANLDVLASRGALPQDEVMDACCSMESL
jgi:hypothetical protein